MGWAVLPGRPSFIDLTGSADAVTENPILHATGIAKNYGAVAALKNASLSVLPGEVHALMGANGAGKSTLVKILTGAVRADRGEVLIRGQTRDIHSPAHGRRAGLVPVYQEPSLIPDLDIASNLRLTDTPVEPFLKWTKELGLPDVDLRTYARDIPLALQRVIDLARALAVQPEVLILDEMTAALPADLAERVIHVIREEGKVRSIIFISHRFLEIAAMCNRATVLRDGETVGVVEIVPGVEEHIVELMLGAKVHRVRYADRQATQTAATGATRIAVKNISVGAKLSDISFEIRDGEVVGVVALEGQGQDELFDVLAGNIRPTSGAIEVDGKPVQFSHPMDAIDAGIGYVPGNRSDALMAQRSVRENIALPFSAAFRHWGPLDRTRENREIGGAIERMQIDIRAQREVQRLSGGNQQKVTIARWLAAGVKTILCFDPSRGIDVRTKQEIYRLVRDLAAQGKSVLFYTSELEEIQLACDRAIVIFGGRIVDVIPAAIADEATLTRAAYGLPRGDDAAVGILAETPAAAP